MHGGFDEPFGGRASSNLAAVKEPIRKLKPRDETLTHTIRYVVAALILRERDEREILICQRRADQPMSLKWEFPGGKIEAGETPEAALARELNEELGIHATIGRHVVGLRHRYRNGASIDLQFFLVREFAGELENKIFNEMRWSPLEALPGYDFLAADLNLVRELADGKLL